LILPCKHLCLCNSCADSLRYQANNCPICRSPFRALLQIRAVQKSNTPIININQADGENIPLGYISVSLIEAINGPINVQKINSIDRKNSFQMIADKEQKATSPVDSLKTIEKSIEAASPLEESAGEMKKSASNSKEKKSLTKNLSLRDRDRDCVKYVNEKSSMNVSLINF
jgi:hypothetical protein